MNNQRYIFFDVLRTIVLNDKQIYQNLINCVIETTTKFDKEQTYDVDNLNFFANVFENQNVIKIKNVFFIIKKSKNDVDVLKIKTKIRIVTKIRNKKRSSLKNFLIFFDFFQYTRKIAFE